MSVGWLCCALGKGGPQFGSVITSSHASSRQPMGQVPLSHHYRLQPGERPGPCSPGLKPGQPANPTGLPATPRRGQAPGRQAGYPRPQLGHPPTPGHTEKGAEAADTGSGAFLRSVLTHQHKAGLLCSCQSPLVHFNTKTRKWNGLSGISSVTRADDTAHGYRQTVRNLREVRGRCAQAGGATSPQVQVLRKIHPGFAIKTKHSTVHVEIKPGTLLLSTR